MEVLTNAFEFVKANPVAVGVMLVLMAASIYIVYTRYFKKEGFANLGESCNPQLENSCGTNAVCAPDETGTKGICFPKEEVGFQTGPPMAEEQVQQQPQEQLQPEQMVAPAPENENEA